MRSTFLLCLILAFAGCALASTGAESRQPLSIAERAQAVDEAIRTRYIGIADSPPVDVCSVFLALGREPAFRDRLSAFARSRLSTEPVESCPASVSAQRQDNGWFVRGIVRSGPGELSLVAAKNGHGGHRETYLMFHGYGDPKLWRVREVRISDFWYE